MQITASDAVEVIGTSADGRRSSSLSAQSNLGIGDAGDLTIDTGRLRVSDGAQVTVGTFGQGKSGSLQITASDAINLIGISANGLFPSGLFTQSNGSRDAGELRVNTGRLRVQGGAVISSRSEEKEEQAISTLQPVIPYKLSVARLERTLVKLKGVRSLLRLERFAYLTIVTSEVMLPLVQTTAV